MKNFHDEISENPNISPRIGITTAQVIAGSIRKNSRKLKKNFAINLIANCVLIFGSLIFLIDSWNIIFALIFYPLSLLFVLINFLLLIRSIRFRIIIMLRIPKLTSFYFLLGCLNFIALLSNFLVFITVYLNLYLFNFDLLILKVAGLAGTFLIALLLLMINKIKSEIKEDIKKYSIIILFGILLSLAPWADLIGMIIIILGLYKLNKIPFDLNQKIHYSSFLNNQAHSIFQEGSGEDITGESTRLEIVAQPKISIKKEIPIQNLETTQIKEEPKPSLSKAPEITNKEETHKPKPITEITVLKAEIEPEKDKELKLKLEIEPISKKEEIKKSGLSNFKIDRKKVSEKPIRSKIVKKEAKTLVPNKCPFCGKKREDLDVPFCYVCGYKFK